MNEKPSLFWRTLLACGVGMWLTGCACTSKRGGFVVCPENLEDGLATIICQPIDAEKAQGDTAEFKVKAEGKDLTYQWFFRGTSGPGDVVDPDPTKTLGGESAHLKVLDVDSAKGGYYWCEIESTGRYGAPAKTRTRDAHLGITTPLVRPTGTAIQVYPPQQASMPPPSSGSTSCGAHCGWVNYQNGGLGFDPDNGSPALVKGLVKVRIGTVYLANTAYNVKYFAAGVTSACLANSASPYPDRKEFSINVNKAYFFTVYFKTPCPPQNAQIFFELSFVDASVP